MKSIVFICLAFFAGAGSAFSQIACFTNKVESPAVAKPSDGHIVSATCSVLVVGWRSNDPNFLVNGTFIDPVTHNAASLPPATNLNCNGGNCTASLAVTPGSLVSWNVQAISIIDERTFYSYPLEGTQHFAIPACSTPQIVKTNSPSMDDDGKREISANEMMKVKLFPNPVHSVLNLSLHADAGNKYIKNAIIKIVDGSGKVIMNQKTTSPNVQVNVKGLSRNAYFIRVEDATGKLLYTARFIKE